MLSQHIFRAYDIRGIAGTDFDESGAEKIGRAYITYLIRNDGIPKPNICVGRDGRIRANQCNRRLSEERFLPGQK
jgi:phosphomannomutase